MKAHTKNSAEGQLTVVQEREKKGEPWVPRWYRKPADMTVLPNEYSEEEVPMWEFTGEGFNRPKPSASPEGEPLHVQPPAERLPALNHNTLYASCVACLGS